MAKNPKSLSTDTAEPEIQVEQGSETITYRPGEGDPVTTKWFGHVFHANVPKSVSNAELIERARTNKFFHVGEFNAMTDAVPVEETTRPKTAEQYRAHAVLWIKTATSVEDLDTRWMAEETLRRECGVGTDDYEYLGTLFNPKRAELRKLDSPT